MRSDEYWQQRMIQSVDAACNRGIEFYHDLESAYRQAASSTEKEVMKLYTRMATENGVSLSEAKKLLTSNELEEFRWSVDEYIAYAKANTISGNWTKQLENASLKYRISRLEAMKIHMQNNVERLYGHELDGFNRVMGDIYTSGYYHTAHAIQTGTHVGVNLAEIDDVRVKKVLDKPWAPDGSNFSKRIWNDHRPKLVNKLHTDLTQSVIRGDSPDALIKSISKDFEVSKNQAGTLVMTESAYFGNAANQDAFKDLGVEEQVFVATLDLKTSKVCQDMDNKVIKTSDIVIGTNAPPLHPRCRSCMAPYFEGLVDERMARGLDGKSDYVPGNLSYHEWYDQYIKPGLPEKKTRKKSTSKKRATKKPHDKPKNLKEKADNHKVDLDDKTADLEAQKVDLSDKKTSLRTVEDEEVKLRQKSADLNAQKANYERVKDRDFDAEIAEQNAKKQAAEKRVQELDAIEKRWHDRPERGTPEREEWRKWRATVDYGEVFDDLVDARNTVYHTGKEIDRLTDLKNIKDGIDIDDLNKKILKVEDDIAEKAQLGSKLKEDVESLNKEIANTRMDIENVYKGAGRDFIDELDGKDFITDDHLKDAERKMHDLRWEYMKTSDPVEYEKRYQAYKDACKKYDELQNSMMQHNAALVKETLEEVRELGASDLKALNTGHLKNSRSKVATAVKKAYEHYPRDWVDISANHSGVNLKKQMRGYYSDGRLEIAISGWNDDSQFRCSMHELGHRFEHVLSGLAELETVFYNRRTEGESLQWLGGNYKKSERSRFDDFVDKYMGKYYDGNFYELVSMGFEYAFTNPKKLMADKDMAEWIYGILMLYMR